MVLNIALLIQFLHHECHPLEVQVVWLQGVSVVRDAHGHVHEYLFFLVVIWEVGESPVVLEGPDGFLVHLHVGAHDHLDDRGPQHPVLVLREVDRDVAVRVQQYGEGTGQVVVLQHRHVVVADGLGVRLLDQELVVHPWVLKIVDYRGQQGCHYVQVRNVLEKVA